MRNPDLKAAAARVEASRYAVRVAARRSIRASARKASANGRGRSWVATSVAASIRRTSAAYRESTTAAAARSDTSVDSSSQRWVYGLGIGAAWEADVWGRVRSKKAAAQAESDALEADYEFARQSLAAAVARAYFSTIEASQQAANAQEILSSTASLQSSPTSARSRVTRATSTWRRSSRAPLPRRTRSTSRRPRARRPSARSRSSPATIPPAASPRAAPSPANREPCPPVCPRKSSNAGPTSSRPSDRFAAAFHRVNEAHAARLPRFALSGIGRTRHRATRRRRCARCRHLEPRRRGHAADLLRRRTQGRAGHPHRRAKSRRRELHRHRAARLRGRGERAGRRLLPAQTRRRTDRGGLE